LRTFEKCGRPINGILSYTTSAFTDQPRLCSRKNRSLQHHPCFRAMINTGHCVKIDAFWLTPEFSGIRKTMDLRIDVVGGVGWFLDEVSCGGGPEITHIMDASAQTLTVYLCSSYARVAVVCMCRWSRCLRARSRPFRSSMHQSAQPRPSDVWLRLHPTKVPWLRRLRFPRLVK